MKDTKEMLDELRTQMESAGIRVRSVYTEKFVLLSNPPIRCVRLVIEAYDDEDGK